MGDRSSGTAAPSAPRVRPSTPSTLHDRPPGPPRIGPEIARAPIEHEHDIRRRRPPVLAFLLRPTSMRRAARIVALPALDFVGVALAIFTALALKELVQDGTVD